MLWGQKKLLFMKILKVRPFYLFVTDAMENPGPVDFYKHIENNEDEDD